MNKPNTLPSTLENKKISCYAISTVLCVVAVVLCLFPVPAEQAALTHHHLTMSSTA